MNSGSSGGFSRLAYDECQFQKKVAESTNPLSYKLYEGKYENCKKCVHNGQFYRPSDLVDVESELKNITRGASKCPQNKYNPFCKKSKSCTSTFDNSVPVVLGHESCPIVYNNINKATCPGYSISNGTNCCNH